MSDASPPGTDPIPSTDPVAAPTPPDRARTNGWLDRAMTPRWEWDPYFLAQLIHCPYCDAILPGSPEALLMTPEAVRCPQCQQASEVVFTTPGGFLGRWFALGTGLWPARGLLAAFRFGMVYRRGL